MTVELLKELSNADAIASRETEVQEILIREMKQYSNQVTFDNLGSVIFHKKGKGPNIMFCAHMDEVGFMIRSISDIGMLYLIAIGGVKDEAKNLQRVRITTTEGRKYYGILNSTKDSQSGKAKDMYVDLGYDSKEEIEALGIQIGDMVCFDSLCESLNRKEIVVGKALDDRVGCYVLAEALKRVKDIKHECDIYMVGTSSEEVGMRGGKTATYRIQPDFAFSIDVANAPDLVRDHSNQRKIGHGCMLVHYDKSMIPNFKLLQFIKMLCAKHDIDYQCDMFSGGGTDTGNAHLIGEGIPSLVIGIPLRLCHGPYSLAHMKDIENTICLVVEIIRNLNEEVYNNTINYIGGR